MDEPKLMRLRYPGVCRICDSPIEGGVRALYEPAPRSVVCLTCAGVIPSSAPDAAGEAAQEPAIDYGEAGASARRECERRAAKDEARLRAAWGPFGGIGVALASERQSTSAWSRGATGEQRVGERLDALRSEGIITLHDRRIPGSRANIDHIAVTASGVVVIDSKRYKGQPRRVVQGGILRPRTERLLVGRRDATSAVHGVHKQVQVVADALQGVPVRGALCFIDAEWPLLGSDVSVDGVLVTWPKRLASGLRAGNHGPVDVEAVARMTAAHFTPA